MLEVAAGRLSSRRRGRSWLLSLGVLAVLAWLFTGYYRMALTVPTTADGAGNAVQAFDLFHGNPLLHGWTVSDVSFYGVELFQFAAIEGVLGLSPQVAPASAALSYTLIVLLVGLLAKGSATGVAARVRIGVALGVVLVPQPGLGQAIVLGGPDHTGAAVPLLLAWLLLDRAGRDQAEAEATREPAARGWVRPRWLPYALGAVLTWGQLADPVLSLVGAVPLTVVCLLRTLRRRAWRGPDVALALAGAGSVPVSYGALWLIGHLGGYRTQAVPTGLVSWGQLASHLRTAVESVTVLFGCHFPELHGWFERSLGAVHLIGVGLAVIAVARTVRLAWRGAGRRVEQVIAAGILVNLAAFVVSALNTDLLASHEIVPVLPLAAVLVARALFSPIRSKNPGPAWLPAARWLVPAVRIAALTSAGLLLAAFAGQLNRPAARPSGAAVADWLASQHLHYGLGGYWVANNITVDSGGTVQVAPLNGISRITGYRWESRRDWYDPAQHDARFIVLQLNSPGFFTVDVAIAQFGQPVARRTLPTSGSGSATVLVYDRNLLLGLPAWCAPGREAPSMAQCR
ncbi:MAG: hypothetical protein M3Y42_15860 [Actinomycetota bacterium]|nr:hypothetical protein [Actinomycetota bacterium]MDQ2958423.1 hypothetical protein [Actinomycetota bacterium]